MAPENDAAEYILDSCLWELTLRCNLHCMHCGSVAGKQREKELTLQECFGVADQIVALGCSELTFIGGEIFLYKGWETVARYLTDKGMRVNIMSNGQSIGEEEVRQIKHARLSNVGISLDGMEQNHNRIRRRADSFARIDQALDLMHRGGVSLGIVTSLLEFNVADLDAMYEYLVSRHVGIWQLQLVNPMGNMAKHRELIIDARRIPSLTEFIREKNTEGEMLVVAADSLGYHDDNEVYIRGRKSPICYWRGCQAGITSLFIDSVGNVKGCGALYDATFIEGNIREESLSAIWADETRFAYNRMFDRQLLRGSCAMCDVADECKGGCRASNFFTTHSLYENAFCSRRTGEGRDAAVEASSKEN